MKRYIFNIRSCIALIFMLLMVSNVRSQTTYKVSKETGAQYQNFDDIPDLAPGDSVLLRAGDVWREDLGFNASGTPDEYIYIGRYGEGDNPLILGSDLPDSWSPVSGETNIWKAEGSFKNTSYGSGDGRIFFLKGQTTSWGEYHHNVALSELTQEFDYTVDSNDDYFVYSSTDPDTKYDAVEIVQRDKCIGFSPDNSYIEINGIDVRFAASKGIWSGYPAKRGATNLVFRNISVEYIGKKTGPNDYGIACFHSNVLIEDCYFSDCGRRAISINTYTSPAGGRRIENIIIRNNEFRRGFHTTALDVSAMDQEGDTIQYLYFYNNYVDDSEITTQELEDGNRSNQIFVQGGAKGKYLISEFYYVNNLFVKAQTRWINFAGTMSHHIWHNTFAGHNPNQIKSPYGSISGGPEKLELYNNIFVDDLPDNGLENNIIHGYNSPETEYIRDYNLFYTHFPGNNRNFTSIDVDGSHKYYHTGEWNDFLADFPDFEQHSPAPADPKFMDYEGGNYRLTENSPANYTGRVLPAIEVTDPYGNKEIINKYDYRTTRLRKPNYPSIGAFEYYDPNSSSLLSIDETSPTIYPNPSSDHIRISLGESSTEYETVDVRIFSILGQNIYSRSFKSATDLYIPLRSDLNSGIYSVEISYGDTKDIQKLIITN